MNQLKIVALKLSNEIKAALIIFGGILLFLIGFNFLNGTSLLKRENTHYAVYDNVEGLQIGTKVTVNGLSVGKVATIDFLPKSEKILVSFTLRNDLTFSKNSVAELYEAGLIGGKSIAILPCLRHRTYDERRGYVARHNKTWFNRCGQPANRTTSTKIRKCATDADSLFVGINNVLNKEGKIICPQP